MGYSINRPDRDAMERLLEREAASPVGTILRLAWLQGLRREEISTLTWPQVEFSDRTLHLPDRTLELYGDMERCLRRRLEACGSRSIFVVISDKYRDRLSPESVSRLARQALDAAGMPEVRLKDLRHDFVLRQMEEHDWPYVIRVSGMSVSTFQSCFAMLQPERKSAAAEAVPDPKDFGLPDDAAPPLSADPLSADGLAVPAFAPAPPSADGRASAPADAAPAPEAAAPPPPAVDEFKLWKILQTERTSPAGLALWMTWQMGLQEKEIVALTWEQIDWSAGTVRLESREVPLTNTVRRVLQEVWETRTPADDPHVLLSPNARRGMDGARLSKLVRTALIRGGMERATLRALRASADRGGEDALILQRAKERRGISRRDVMALLGVSDTAAYTRLRALTESGRLIRMDKKYYLPGTVVTPEAQSRVICAYLAETGPAYCADLARQLQVGKRKCAEILKRMVDSGALTQFEKRYYLTETARQNRSG